MDEKYAEKLLDVLLSNSRALIVAGFGVDRAAHAFFAVLGLLHEKPSLRTKFVLELDKSFSAEDPWRLDRLSVPLELIELAAFDLRWDEFRALAENRIRMKFNSDPNFAASDLSTRVLRAMRDDWEDKDIYFRHGDSDTNV